MIIDTQALIASGQEFEADVAIVGGGTVGFFLATQLRELGRSVIVIEGGSNIPSTKANATASVTGRPHDGTAIGRASGLGGTSAFWGGQLAEFDEYDFDRSDADWGGITADEMAQLYRSTYVALGLGLLPSIDFCRARFGAENKTKTDTEIEVEVERFFTSWLPQPNFAALYKSSIVSDLGLMVMLEAPVHRLEFKGGRAKVAIAKHVSGSEIRVRADSFVLAAGTIENSRLCLAMARDKNCPWSSNQHIGRNFQDHLGHCVGTVTPLDETKFRNYFENGWIEGVKLQPKLRFTHNSRVSEKSGVSGFFLFDSELSSSISNIKGLVRALIAGVAYSNVKRLPHDFIAVGSKIYPLVRRFALERRVMAVFDRGISLYIQAEQIPQVESRIHLVSENTKNDKLPQVNVHWSASGSEGDAILRFVAATENYLRERGLASLIIDPELYLDPLKYLERFRDTYHQCGGMCIASSPSRGAVDPNCRVWGTENVYVAGASVFPVASHANPTLTALALSYRLAKKIADAR
jgi:choline dehydrogenase-like flavoprotein